MSAVRWIHVKENPSQASQQKQNLLAHGTLRQSTKIERTEESRPSKAQCHQIHFFISCYSLLSWLHPLPLQLHHLPLTEREERGTTQLHKPTRKLTAHSYRFCYQYSSLCVLMHLY